MRALAAGKGFFARMAEGLTKARQGFTDRISGILSGRTRIDDELFDDLEEALIQADAGAATASLLVEHLRERVRREKVTDPAAVRDLLRDEVGSILAAEEGGLSSAAAAPTVYVFVGVNGVGKTTTIGKLAAHARAEGRRVILAAGDTFRAAAGEQLEIWGQRTGCDVIRHADGADPAAVAFDAIQAARARKAELVLVDTAGRLHTKANLMEELKKICRVIARECPGAPHEVLLVLDATTGLNAIQQARLFRDAVGVTGIILTKLDGTAKGGVIVAIKNELGIPVKYVGIGEAAEDLRPFVAADFTAALF